MMTISYQLRKDKGSCELFLVYSNTNGTKAWYETYWPCDDTHAEVTKEWLLKNTKCIYSDEYGSYFDTLISSGAIEKGKFIDRLPKLRIIHPKLKSYQFRRNEKTGELYLVFCSFFNSIHKVYYYNVYCIYANIYILTSKAWLQKATKPVKSSDYISLFKELVDKGREDKGILINRLPTLKK